MNKIALRQLRKDAGFSQAQAAQKLGIGITAYSNYELGKRIPDANMLQRMAELFDCTSDYLLGSSEYKNADEALQAAARYIVFQNNLGSLDSLNYLSQRNLDLLAKEINSLCNYTREYNMLLPMDEIIESLVTIINKINNSIFNAAIITNKVLDQKITEDHHVEQTIPDGMHSLLDNKHEAEKYILNLYTLLASVIHNSWIGEISDAERSEN